MSRPSVLIVCVFCAAGLLGAANLAGCRPAGPPQAKVPDRADGLAALALLPAGTEIVLSLDLRRLRGQPVWKALSSALARNAGPVLSDIAAGIGLDPARQVHRLWVGLPGERQNDGRFVLLAETDPINAARATTWLKNRTRGELSVVLLTPKQILVSKGVWAQDTRAHLSHSAADNTELRRLCERAAGEHSAWFAAVVPPTLRHTLMEAGRFSDVASLGRVFGFLGDAAGLHVELVGEFGNTTDPPQVAHRLEALRNQAKRDPDMLVAGLSPYLEAVHVDARDACIRIALDLPDSQAGNVIERIEALARTPRTKYSRRP